MKNLSKVVLALLGVMLTSSFVSADVDIKDPAIKARALKDLSSNYAHKVSIDNVVHARRYSANYYEIRVVATSMLNEDLSKRIFDQMGKQAIENVQCRSTRISDPDFENYISCYTKFSEFTDTFSELVGESVPAAAYLEAGFGMDGILISSLSCASEKECSVTFEATAF